IEKAIINLLSYHGAQTAIIFANTRSMVARLTAKFLNRGFKVVSLSGELSQAERGNAMQALRDGRANVCVATDVAARGIDLPGLELVIHADLPSNAETLLHRSGRTGRAGRKGQSVLVVPGRQQSKAQRLLRAAKLDAEWGAPPSAEEVLAQEEARIISGPGLSEPLSAEESAFAERLLAGNTPEQVAAAFLRLYREYHSAPEILGAVPEGGKREKTDHTNFGPSTWFSLSLGRKDRAEPRWLLPMLCRNAGLAKNAIGAIRVQYQETFVEIANEAIPAMKQELGAGMEIEQGAALTELPGIPDFDASPKGPPAAPRNRDDAPKHRKGRPSKETPPAPKAKPTQEDAKAAPKPKKSKDRAHDTSPRAPEGDKRKPRKAAPHTKQEGAKQSEKPAQNDEKREKRKKNAADTSKSFRAGKPRHAPKQKPKTAAPARRPNAKGGNAKPFRKPSKRT
ncbi:MAG: DbpA RNA binding domain-containing protein, partial [Rhodobacteraceae bacterium]|nr:DbpA RNA binding domain-containing protein [Paracoccaceae bacterium]